jgi:mono/diheme cytochrome c family protein
MKGRLGIGLLLTAVALSVFAQTSTVPYEELATIVLPKGDVKGGRQAFLDLKCHACHRVAGEIAFPAPVADMRGPDLDATLRSRDASEVAAAIIVPSHSSSVRSSARVKEALARQMNSPMADFSGVLTVRQLSDVLAYLRSVR